MIIITIIIISWKNVKGKLNEHAFIPFTFVALEVRPEFLEKLFACVNPRLCSVNIGNADKLLPLYRDIL